MLFFTLFWILWLCAAGLAQAVAPGSQWIVRQYGVAEGLPQERATCVIQAKNRFLWIGTHGGLVRFDGQHFVVYDIASHKGLASNRVRSLCEASNGDLWIGSFERGVSRKRGDAIVSFAGTPNAPIGRVRRIVEDGAGTVWFLGERLTRCEGSAFVVEDLGDLSPGRLLDLFAGPGGELWLSTERGLFERRAGEWRPTLDDAGAAIAGPHHVGAGPWGRWAHCRAGFGLLREGRFERLAQGVQLPARVNASVVDAHGRAWCASGAELYRMRVSLEPRVTPRLQLSKVETPRLAEIRSFCADNEGNLWVGGRGLTFLRPEPFEQIPFWGYGKARFPRPIPRSRREVDWVAHDGAALRRYAEGRWPILVSDRELGSVDALALGANGSLWIAHSDGRLQHREPDGSVMFEHELGPVYRLCECKKGSVWIVCERGLWQFIDGRFRAIVADPDKLPIRRGRPAVIAESRAGRPMVAWIGHVLYVGEDGVTTIRDGLPDVEIRSIYEEAGGALWLATYGAGLLRWKDGTLTRVDTRHGLPSNSLGRIVEGEPGVLWINSNDGVFRVNIEELSATADGRRHAVLNTTVFPTGEGNGEAGGRLADGRVWFPTTTRIVVFDPATVVTNTMPPLPRIESIHARGEAHSPGSELVLAPEVDHVVVRFDAVSLTRPSRLQLRYKLEGRDADWIDAGESRVARYLDVPPGEYRFLVMAANEDGVWSPRPAALNVRFAPRFVETIWFGLVCVLVLGALVYGLHRLRLGLLERKNRELVEENARRRDAEALLQDREQRLGMALSAARIGSWRWSRATGLSERDAILNAMLGREAKRDESDPDDFRDMIHPEDRAEAKACFDEALLAGDGFTREFRLLRPDGGIRWVRDHARVLKKPDGEIEGMTGISVDITDVKEAEAARELYETNMRHKQRMEAIGQLASGVAHEFNNLLLVMMGNAELLEQILEAEGDAEPKAILADIRRSGARAVAVTQGLLSFAKKVPLETHVFDLNKVVEDSERTFLGLLGSRIDLHIDLARDLPAVEADRLQVEQALLNLVLNARDAITDRGAITVRTSLEHCDEAYVLRNPSARVGDFVRLLVADSGRGMSPDVIERIFDPFFTTKPVGEGTGLGLATTFADVTKMGGHITVESQLGIGSTLCIYLPVAARRPARTSVDNGSEAVRSAVPGTETILVCDDEPMVLAVLVRMLRGAGYRVVEAEGPEAAIEALRDFEGMIDLVLTDVSMPGKSGPELVEELLEERPELRWAWISGNVGNGVPSGVGGEVIHKPVTKSELLRGVRKALGKF